MTHTPTPYKVEQGQGYHDGHWVITAEGMPANSPLAHIQQTCGPEESYPDALFIVKACNAHEELVSALKGMIELMDNKPTSYDEDQQISSYRAILSNAEKGSQL